MRNEKTCVSLRHQTNKNTVTMETMKLRNGLTAIAKTYANRTQAEKAQAKIAYEFGVETSIYHRGTPFFLIVK